jgi:hypothetical protein
MKVTLAINLLNVQPLCRRARGFRLLLLLTLVALSPALAMAATEERKMDPRITAFIAEKRTQIEKTSKEAGRPVPRLVQDFFAAAARANWHTATNAAEHALRFGESGGAESDPEENCIAPLVTFWHCCS